MSALLTALTTVGAGMLLGVRHATDSDHLVVVSAMVQREPRLRTAVRTAAAWGLGHSVTFLGVGAAIIAFGLHPPASLETFVDAAIATMLIGVGLWHLRGRQPPATDATRRGGIRSFSFGLVHGLAGSGAIALLALTTISSRLGAAAYLVAFAMGTVIGMAIFTAVISLPLRWSARRAMLDRGLIVATSVASIAVGALIGVGIWS